MTSPPRHLAGYPRRDEEEKNNKKALNELPTLDILTSPVVYKGKKPNRIELENPIYDPHFPEINNPLVLRALHELRKVVNGVIREHGRPARIHLEMARDLKMSPKQREDYLTKIRGHEKERETAKKKLEENGIAPTRDAVTLYRLWEEQKHLCIYSGKTICLTDHLLGGEIHIDHIYPRRAGDDSYLNKVVCFWDENGEKGDRLPSEWLAADPEKFEAIQQRAAKLKLHPAKRRRLRAEKLPEGFTERDLVDTAYMARAARHYLTLLVDEPHHVLCTKGRHTGFLRNHWQINHLLRDDQLDLKNRDDHRHHALDAILIALCDGSRLQHISAQLKYKNRWEDERGDNGKIVRRYRLKPTADNLPAPWPTFRDDVQTALDSIWVSHKPNRKLSGKLHEETNYGATGKPGELVRRKPVASLSPKELKDRIRDPEIEKILKAYVDAEQRLYRHNCGKMTEEIEGAFGEKASLTAQDIALIADPTVRKDLAKKLEKKNPLHDAEHDKITMPSGVPIKKIRLLTPNEAARPLRPGSNPKEYIIPGNTHHLAIFTLGKDKPSDSEKHHFEAVTLLEATRRKRTGEPVVQRTYRDMPPEAEFKFHLCSGDSMMAEIDGKERLFTYQTIASTTKQAKFTLHTDARPSTQKEGQEARKLFTCKPNTFAKNFPNARKVEVLPHGEIRHIDGQ